MSFLLTEKEKLRLAKVKKDLAENKNPYSELSKLTLGNTPHTRDEGQKPLLSQSKRLSKWIDNIDSRPSKRITRKKISDTPNGQVCMCCLNPLDLITSTLGKIILSFDTKRVEGKQHFIKSDKSLLTVNTIQDSKFPRYQRGRVCPNCVDKLDEFIMVDTDYSRESSNVLIEQTSTASRLDLVIRHRRK
jgi:hypothetical protein